GEDLLRFTLISRDGAWFITEHEFVDDALGQFADAFASAIRGRANHYQLYDAPIETALKTVEKELTSEGETTELLLLKYRLLAAADYEKAGEKTGDRPGASLSTDASDPSVELLKQLITRWPDFAAGHLAMARELLYADETQEPLSPLSKDTET